MEGNDTQDIISCKKCGVSKGVDDFYKRKDTGKYRMSCKQCWAVDAREYRKINKSYLNEAKKQWQKQHPGMRAAIVHRYYIKNKPQIKEYQKYYKRERQTLQARIIANYRGRIWKAIKRGDKSERTTTLLGCSIEKFKKHLEKRFLDGMNWGNYGEWHVDHIRPCAKFDLSAPKQQMECFNYRNTQPLWAIDNKHKRDRWIINTV